MRARPVLLVLSHCRLSLLTYYSRLVVQNQLLLLIVALTSRNEFCPDGHSRLRGLVCTIQVSLHVLADSTRGSRLFLRLVQGVSAVSALRVQRLPLDKVGVHGEICWLHSGDKSLTRRVVSKVRLIHKLLIKCRIRGAGRDLLVLLPFE